MSGSDCKPLADADDFLSLRRSILNPSGVEDASLRTAGPFAYCDLDVVERFGVVGYMGHL
jgi:hypothetical protein